LILFADTSYYLALLYAGDENHQAARSFTSGFDGELVTTCWVVTELANALSKGSNRRSFMALLDDLRNDKRVQIVPANADLFDRGLELYLRRNDKDGSLTDCISFVVMEDLGLMDALTTGRHFEQAGFHVVLT